MEADEDATEKEPKDAETDDAPEANAAEEVATPGLAATDDEAPKVKKKRKKKASATTSTVDPLAVYLARLLAATRGYVPGAPAEAARFAAAVDVVMTLQTGLGFAILGIVDATKDDDVRFSISQAELVEIGKECHKFAGKSGFSSLSKLPVGFHVIELRSSLDETDKERLRALARIPGLQKVEVRTSALGTRDREAWTSSRFDGELRALLLEALESPQKSPEALAKANAPVPKKPPNATIAILALMALMFGAELAFGVGKTGGAATPSLDTLIAMGGVSPGLVSDGEWWRLMTATLLHADPIHLILNGVAMAMGGFVLESIVGSAWLVAIFVLGALGGSIGSVLINDPNLVSVGASGAIMGVIAAAMIASKRMPPAERTQVMMNLARILIPSLLPIALHKTEGKIDFAAHFGGAVTGALVGYAVLSRWKQGAEEAPLERFARATAVAGAIAYVVGFGLVNTRYATYAEAGQIELVPNDQIQELKKENVDRLLAKYPRDWRVLWVAGEKEMNAGDLVKAEKLMRDAIAQHAIVKRSFPKRELEASLRAELAKLLDVQGRHDEARAIAKPACEIGGKEIAPFCP